MLQSAGNLTLQSGSQLRGLGITSFVDDRSSDGGFVDLLSTAGSISLGGPILIPGANHTFGARHPFAGPTPQLIQAMNATQGWLRRYLW